jgi:hypothetical protein
MRAKSEQQAKVIIYWTSLLLIVFLGYTAFNKLLNITSFQDNLFKVGLFPNSLIPTLSYLVIFGEFIVIAFLIFSSKMGLLLTALMMCCFTIYISYLNYNGLYEICGCGGVLNGLPYKYHLIINLLLLSSSLSCLFLSNKSHNEN